MNERKEITKNNVVYAMYSIPNIFKKLRKGKLLLEKDFGWLRGLGEELFVLINEFSELSCCAKYFINNGGSKKQPKVNKNMLQAFANEITSNEKKYDGVKKFKKKAVSIINKNKHKVDKDIWRRLQDRLRQYDRTYTNKKNNVDRVSLNKSYNKSLKKIIEECPELEIITKEDLEKLCMIVISKSENRRKRLSEISKEYLT